MLGWNNVKNGSLIKRKLYLPELNPTTGISFIRRTEKLPRDACFRTFPIERKRVETFEKEMYRNDKKFLPGILISSASFLLLHFC